MISKMLRFILIGDYNDVKYSKKKFDHFNMVFFQTTFKRGSSYSKSISWAFSNYYTQLI